MKRNAEFDDDELLADEEEDEEVAPPRRRHWLLRLARAVVILGVAWFVGLCLFIDLYGHYDQAQRAQVIVICGAGVGPDGQPRDSLRARTLHAVSLYKRGLAGKIICTGGLGDFPPTEAQVAASLAEQEGVDAGDLLLETTSTNTRENVQNAAEICRREQWTHVLAVSDPYHLWRVQRNFSAQGLTAYTSPARNCERNRHLGMRAQWTAREAVAITRDMAKEAGRLAWGKLTERWRAK